MYFRHSTLLASLLFISSTVFGQNFLGQAVHKQEVAAKQQAISDLQQNIYVNVESISETYQTNQGDDSFKFTSKLSSTLPILGVKTDCYMVINMVQCEASLDTNTSSIMYQAAIKQKQEVINDIWGKVKNISSAQVKYKELEKLLKLVHETKQLTLVLSIISPETNISLRYVSRIEIMSQLLALEKSASSLQMAAIILSKKLSVTDKVLVKPFTLYQSSEITPFSTALQTQISNHVTAVSELKQAMYVLQGKYRIADKKIHLEGQLVDLRGEIINAFVLSLDKSAVSEFEYEPRQFDFERLLYSGQVIGKELKAKMTTNKGQRDLLFKKGETIKLLVKINQPSYFYIIGHSNNEKNKLSYLLDLNDVTGDDKFISYLGIEEVNKWVVIGEFEAEIPYGNESLQLFAATEKPTALLPSTQFDGTYYVVGDKRKNVINKTRGIIKKKQAKSDKKLEIVESVLSLNTTRGY